MQQVWKLVLILGVALFLGIVAASLTGFKDWYLPIALHIVFISGIYNFFLRRMVVTRNIYQRLFLQYLFCTTLALSLFVFGRHSWNKFLPVILVAGILNGLGTFFNWKATQINLSIQSLFLFLDDIIAVLLAWIILGEWIILTGGMKIGLLVILLVIFRIIGSRFKELLREGGEREKIFTSIPTIFLSMY